jgi:hypothetical protein
MRLVTVDIGALRSYAKTNSALASLNNFSNINTLYVADLRSTSGLKITNVSTVTSTNKSYYYPWVLNATNRITNVVSGKTTYTTNYAYVWTNKVTTATPAVMLTNGATVPSGGLTVASLDPVYTMGDFNTSVDGAAFYTCTSNTSHTLPCAIMADAVTILSSNFSFAYSFSTNALTNRVAALNTTVNTAILAGNVPSDGTYYSGGLENFPRFLEDWSGKTIYYNGSMVCLFPSQIANQPWGSANVYNPPSRNWTFDTNFLGDATKLPPNAPNIAVSSKGRVVFLTNGATSF